MRHSLIALIIAGCTAAPALAQAPASAATPACTFAAARGPYGFNCHGFSFTGATFEPVTFVGTVAGSATGFYDGYGTFNTSGGTIATHFAGQATLDGARCFGRVSYTTFEMLLPGGGTVPLPPASFDFAVVLGGKELLGTGVAPAGVTGDLVPRLTCRLVRTAP